MKREEIDELLERLEGKKPCWVSETMKEAAELIRELKLTLTVTLEQLNE